MSRGPSSWRRALAAALATDPGRRIAARPSEIRAAVLVFLLEEPGKLDLVLERRSDDLPNHAGQFAFPGGAVDPEDRSPEETALREAWEEIGLEPSAVEILGLLSDIRTPTGYVITPVVGVASGPLEFRSSPEEVARILRVPAGILFQEGAFHPVRCRTRGLLITSMALVYEGEVIWGATARVLLSLRRVLAHLPGPWLACRGD